MKNDELLDLVNEKDEVIGTVWKSEAHANPKLIHREVAVLVLSKSKEVLIQKRSFKKVHDPGDWEIGIAGHVGAGENPLEAAKRELYEEVGLGGDPVFVYKYLDRYKKETRFFWCYVVIVDTKPPIKFDVDEVEEVHWINISELSEFAAKNRSHAMDGSIEIVDKILAEIKL